MAGEVLNQLLESENPETDVTELAFGQKTKLLNRKRKDPKKSRAAKLSYRKNKNKIKKGLAKFRKSGAGKALNKKLARFNKMRKHSSLSVAGEKVLEKLHLSVLELSRLQFDLAGYHLESIQEDVSKENLDYPFAEDVVFDMAEIAEHVSEISNVLLNGFNETEDADDVEGLLQDADELLLGYSSDEADD